MNLWRRREKSQQAARLSHNFVVGPPRHSDLFGRAARLYMCARCKWRFEACGSKVVVLNDDGSPIVGEESLRRFNTFAQGPCPALEVPVSAPLTGPESLPVRSRTGQSNSRKRASLPVSIWPGRPRPLLRVLTRPRETSARSPNTSGSKSRLRNGSRCGSYWRASAKFTREGGRPRSRRRPIALRACRPI
jgi:hypothetical protein